MGSSDLPDLDPPRSRRSTRVAFAVCAYLLVVACATFVPRHGWSETLGPVVPHDSFPADCTLCHDKGGWQTLRADFSFDHEKETGVALHGAHAEASCLMCHNDRGPVQEFAARGCGGCHADPHMTRLGRNCEDCHDERTWRPREAIASHDRTRFPLVGAHAAAACFRCHPGAQVGNFAGASAECQHCHADDRARATDPDHELLGYSLDCSECHLPIDWKPARFDHPASIPIVGGHSGLECRACHTTPNSFGGLDPACASCHADEHAATSQPSHSAAGFGLDCTQCHTVYTFGTSSWTHPEEFPLTFGHAGRGCTECHVGQSYAGTSGDCASCHLANYQATTSPNHTAAQYPTDCALCHGTAGWQGAVGEHPASFPLENAHALACTQCHTTPGTFTGLDPTCGSCHQDDYQATTNPSHTAFQMSQQCDQCHGTVAWNPSTFVHNFPINGGKHGGLACFDCHDNPANRSLWECINCHEHNQQSMNNEHQGVSNYQWLSSACYACHPDGRE